MCHTKWYLFFGICPCPCPCPYIYTSGEKPFYVRKWEKKNLLLHTITYVHFNIGLRNFLVKIKVLKYQGHLDASSILVNICTKLLPTRSTFFGHILINILNAWYIYKCGWSYISRPWFIWKYDIIQQLNCHYMKERSTPSQFLI